MDGGSVLRDMRDPDRSSKRSDPHGRADLVPEMPGKAKVGYLGAAHPHVPVGCLTAIARAFQPNGNRHRRYPGVRVRPENATRGTTCKADRGFGRGVGEW